MNGEYMSEKNKLFLSFIEKNISRTKEQDAKGANK